MDKKIFKHALMLFLLQIFIFVGYPMQQTISTPNNNRLLGVVYDVGRRVESVAVVDPTTGDVVPFGDSIADCCILQGHGSAFDPATGRLFAILGYQGTTHIFTFNIQTGEYTATPVNPNFLVNYLVSVNRETRLYRKTYVPLIAVRP